MRANGLVLSGPANGGGTHRFGEPPKLRQIRMFDVDQGQIEPLLGFERGDDRGAQRCEPRKNSSLPFSAPMGSSAIHIEIS